MKAVHPRALWVFALGALALVAVRIFDYGLFLQGTNTAFGAYLFSTISSVTLFYPRSASLALFESSSVQRFLFMSASVVLFLGSPALIPWMEPSAFMSSVMFSFIYGFTGLLSVAVAAVSVFFALGPPRTDAPEEDETLLPHY